MTDRVEGDALSRQFGCLGHWSFGTPHSCGVGILFHSRLTVTNLVSGHDDHGRMVWVDFEFRSQRFRFVNVYAPNEGRDRVLFFDYVYTLLHSNRVTVLGGDFNCVEDLGLDKVGGSVLAGSLGSVGILVWSTRFGTFTLPGENILSLPKGCRLASTVFMFRVDCFQLSMRWHMCIVRTRTTAWCSCTLVVLSFRPTTVVRGTGSVTCRFWATPPFAMISWRSGKCVSPLLSRTVPGGRGVRIAFGPCCIRIRFAWLGSGLSGSGTSWGG